MIATIMADVMPLRVGHGRVRMSASRGKADSEDAAAFTSSSGHTSRIAGTAGLRGQARVAWRLCVSHAVSRPASFDRPIGPCWYRKLALLQKRRVPWPRRRRRLPGVALSGRALAEGA